MSAKPRMSIGTLAPVFVLACSAAVAGAAIGAWLTSVSKDGEVRQAEAERDEALSRAALLEMMARNASDGDVVEPSKFAAKVSATQMNAAPELRPVEGAAAPSQAVKAPPASPAARPLKEAPKPVAVAPVAVPTKAVARQAAQPPSAAASAAAQPSRLQAPSPSIRETVTVIPSAAAAANQVALPAVGGIEAPQAQTAEAKAPGAPARPQPAVPAQEPARGAAPARTAQTGPSGQDRMVLVPAAQIGVARIEPGVVVMLSGKRVRVGETFDSGEVLREADPARNRIVTDQRSMVLL